MSNSKESKAKFNLKPKQMDASFTKPVMVELNFLSPISKKLCCSGCQNLLRDPCQVTCCKTIYCKDCIDRLTSTAEKCPNAKCGKSYSIICNGPMDELRRKISQLKVYCIKKSNGCKWSGTLEQMERSHFRADYDKKDLLSCQFQKVMCPNDCGALLPRGKMEEHRFAECTKEMCVCEYCGVEESKAHINKVHHRVCPAVPVECPNQCKTPGVARADILRHVEEDCPLRRVRCEYRHVGCNEEVLFQDVSKHNAESYQRHLELMSEKLEFVSNENQDLRLENEQLHEEIASLMSKIKDYEIPITPRDPYVPMDPVPPIRPHLPAVVPVPSPFPDFVDGQQHPPTEAPESDYGSMTSGASSNRKSPEKLIVFEDQDSSPGYEESSMKPAVDEGNIYEDLDNEKFNKFRGVGSQSKVDAPVFRPDPAPELPPLRPRSKSEVISREHSRKSTPVHQSKSEVDSREQSRRSTPVHQDDHTSDCKVPMPDVLPSRSSPMPGPSSVVAAHQGTYDEPRSCKRLYENGLPSPFPEGSSSSLDALPRAFSTPGRISQSPLPSIYEDIGQSKVDAPVSHPDPAPELPPRSKPEVVSKEQSRKSTPAHEHNHASDIKVPMPKDRPSKSSSMTGSSSAVAAHQGTYDEPSSCKRLYENGVTDGVPSLFPEDSSSSLDTLPRAFSTPGRNVSQSPLPSIYEDIVSPSKKERTLQSTASPYENFIKTKETVTTLNQGSSTRREEVIDTSSHTSQPHRSRSSTMGDIRFNQKFVNAVKPGFPTVLDDKSFNNAHPTNGLPAPPPRSAVVTKPAVLQDEPTESPSPYAVISKPLKDESKPAPEVTKGNCKLSVASESASKPIPPQTAPRPMAKRETRSNSLPSPEGNDPVTTSSSTPATPRTGRRPVVAPKPLISPKPARRSVVAPKPLISPKPARRPVTRQAGSSSYESVGTANVNQKYDAPGSSASLPHHFQPSSMIIKELATRATKRAKAKVEVQC